VDSSANKYSIVNSLLCTASQADGLGNHQIAVTLGNSPPQSTKTKFAFRLQTRRAAFMETYSNPFSF